MLGIIRAIQS